MARVSLSNNMTEPGCLLAHQSIEAFIKAIARLEPNARQPWGHDLVELIKEVNKIIPHFNKIIENEAKIFFLSQLHNVYLWKRYGEAKSTIGTGVIQIMDEILSELKQIYLDVMKAPSTKIFIPESLKETFLKENSYFKENDITSDPLASFGLPRVSF